jgi:hypothetical protein
VIVKRGLLGFELLTAVIRSDCVFWDVVGWGETESTWYVGHYLAYCNSPER